MFLDIFSGNVLTHLFPMHPFSTPWKHQKILRFMVNHTSHHKKHISKPVSGRTTFSRNWYFLKVIYVLWKNEKLKKLRKKYYRPENRSNVVAPNKNSEILNINLLSSYIITDRNLRKDITKFESYMCHNHCIWNNISRTWETKYCLLYMYMRTAADNDLKFR